MAGDVRGRSASSAQNRLELEQDDVSKRRPGVAKKSTLLLGHDPRRIDTAQARSANLDKPHEIKPGVYQCEVLKCGEADYTPVESFLIKS